MYLQPASAESEDKMKISSEQKADIVRRIQVKNPDGTWAERYGALAKEFNVSRCLISHIAKCAGSALANEQAALETAISRLEADLSFDDMRRAPREAIAKYILVLLLGTAFLAGLVTLIRTERIYRSPTVSQSAITGQPTFASHPGGEKSD